MAMRFHIAGRSEKRPGMLVTYLIVLSTENAQLSREETPTSSSAHIAHVKAPSTSLERRGARPEKNSQQKIQPRPKHRLEPSVKGAIF